jgi:hypothetical protein
VNSPPLPLTAIAPIIDEDNAENLRIRVGELFRGGAGAVVSPVVYIDDKQLARPALDTFYVKRGGRPGAKMETAGDSLPPNARNVPDAPPATGQSTTNAGDVKAPATPD